MKLIYTNENRLLVFNAKNILENAGLQTLLKNEYASGGAGDLAVLSTWLELWVVNDRHYDLAIQTLKSAFKCNEADAWVCKSCEETNEGSFDICWNCQSY